MGWKSVCKVKPDWHSVLTASCFTSAIYNSSLCNSIMMLLSARRHLCQLPFLHICLVIHRNMSVYIVKEPHCILLNNKSKRHVPFGWWDSSLPMSDLPSSLMAALGAIMIMMEISQAITGRQHSAQCRHANGLICNWEKGKWLWARSGFVW